MQVILKTFMKKKTAKMMLTFVFCKFKKKKKKKKKKKIECWKLTVLLKGRGRGGEMGH